MSSLSPDAEKVLSDSSSDAFVDSFRRLTGEFASGTWIGLSNRYRNEPVKQLRDDLRRGSVSHSDLAEYIAASAPLHCADGWSFLGRALQSHAAGDPHVARHLAYYAELRAATSILASQGVGIFKNQHFIVNSAGKCELIPKGRGTHDMVWLALEYWARQPGADGQPGAVDVLADIVHPAGVALGVWLDVFDVRSWRSIGQEWLTTWGIDLQHFSQDHDARNEAAYRPTAMAPRAALQSLDASRFLRELWTTYEPDPRSGFEGLDRHLLRLSLEKAFSVTQSPRNTRAKFRNRIDSMLGSLNLPEGSMTRWRQFLMRESDPKDIELIDQARKPPNREAQDYHLQVIARASLLLRVATGCCARLLARNQLRFDDLRFWWSPMAADRGLWDPASEPSDVVDLWQDVEQAIDTIIKWENNAGRSLPSRALLREECASAISLLSNCELIGLWGLAMRWS